MTSLLFHFLLWLINQGSPQQIPERNRAKEAAAQAFRQGRYRSAAQTYEQLSRTTFFPEVEVLLNLAHAYFLLNDTASAQRHYARLFRAGNPRLASTAWAQSALLRVRSRDTAQALIHLRQALTLDPDNAPARYNYELLRYRFRPRPEVPRPETSPPPPRPNQNPPPRTSQQVLPSERREQTLDRLRRYSLTEAQAQQLLDALNATELQYIQQQRRRATHSANPEKPW